MLGEKHYTAFIHSIGMCRMRRFLAVLRGFFHSSLLYNFSCHPSAPTIRPSSLTSSCHLFLGLLLIPGRPWGPPGLRYKGYYVSFAEVKRPGHGVDQPPPSSAEDKKEDKKEDRYTSILPWTFMNYSKVKLIFLPLTAVIIIIIRHQLSLDRPVLASSKSLFEDLSSRLRPFGL